MGPHSGKGQGEMAHPIASLRFRSSRSAEKCDSCCDERLIALGGWAFEFGTGLGFWDLGFGISKLAALTNPPKRRIFQTFNVGEDDAIEAIFFAAYKLG